MPYGLSLHIGLNSFDSNHYGSSGDLKGCENDARDLKKIADDLHYNSSILLTKKATRKNVVEKIKQAAKKLHSGDIFFISYSGHGGRVPDLNRDEDDLLDETWCLYDAQLIDDELSYLWSKFESGVRILALSDSCHSGTVLKPGLPTGKINTTAIPRFIAYEQATDIFKKNHSFYKKVVNRYAGNSKLSIRATVRLLSGCQDNQYSYDGKDNGVFTGVLKHIWNGGDFSGNYEDFYNEILTKMPDYQSPNHFLIGEQSDEFNKQKPFLIK